jgi:hypothetical protein
MDLNMSEDKTNPNSQDPPDREFLEKMLAGVTQQYASSDLHRQIQINNQKLIDCRHEIVMSLTAFVYQQDDEGKDIAAAEICRKNFHIPVPANQDYNEYMKSFFSFLENCITQSATESENKGSSNNE